jgi:putative ABC transport system permease protein
MNALWQDIRYALRQLRKNPGFTAVAVITLALGIGANTAIFSLFQNVLLKPLPYPEQDRLVLIYDWSKDVPFDSICYRNFLDWRELQKSFTAIGVARPIEFNYIGASETERLKGASASYDLFTTIGMPPIRGRLFTPEDDRPGAGRTIIIRASLWKRLFGGRESVIGDKITLSGEPYTIIGILPDEFKIPLEGADFWTPFSLSLTRNDLGYYYRGHFVYAYGRLKPGISMESARSSMRILSAQMEKEHPSGGYTSEVLPLSTVGTDQVRPALYVLLGAAGFVLLIACANIANLQLARVHVRAQEFAMRAVLGSGRRRIVRQVLIESSMLGLLGCGAGLIFGFWLLAGLKTVLSSGASRVNEASLNGWVLGFTALAGLATSLISGLLPAFQAGRGDLREALVQTSRSAGSMHGNRWRAGLIVSEFALTSVLLVGAGLMLRTLGNLHRKDLGFKTEHVITFDWMLKGGQYEDPGTRFNMANRALERLAALPGVTHTGLAYALPLTQPHDTVYCIQGAPLNEIGKMPSVEFNIIGGDFFGALGITEVAGRAFNPRDNWQSPRVVVVDTMFAEKEFHGKNPVGQHFWPNAFPPKNESDWYEIIGVVKHISSLGPIRSARPQVYFTYAQYGPGSTNFVVRTDLNPDVFVPTLRAGLREVASDVSISNVQTMDQLFTSNISTQRLVVTLLEMFGALALLLAGVGLFGVLSYNVGQRTREIGIRMALGATPDSVIGSVMSVGLKLAGIGLAFGLFAALGLTQFLRTLLYELSAFDPMTFIGAAVVLAGIGLLACWLPARRAAKVDPMVALRYE